MPDQLIVVDLAFRRNVYVWAKDINDIIKELDKEGHIWIRSLSAGVESVRRIPADKVKGLTYELHSRTLAQVEKHYELY